jgi:hypothetical protein
MYIICNVYEASEFYANAQQFIKIAKVHHNEDIINFLSNRLRCTSEVCAVRVGSNIVIENTREKLCICAKHGFLHEMKHCLDGYSGVDLYSELLLIAYENVNVDMITYLVSKGARVKSVKDVLHKLAMRSVHDTSHIIECMDILQQGDYVHLNDPLISRTLMLSLDNQLWDYLRDRIPNDFTKQYTLYDYERSDFCNKNQKYNTGDRVLSYLVRNGVMGYADYLMCKVFECSGQIDLTGYHLLTQVEKFSGRMISCRYFNKSTLMQLYKIGVPYWVFIRLQFEQNRQEADMFIRQLFVMHSFVSSNALPKELNQIVYNYLKIQ